MSQKCLQTKLSYESARKYFDVIFTSKYINCLLSFMNSVVGNVCGSRNVWKNDQTKKKICRKLSDY